MGGLGQASLMWQDCFCYVICFLYEKLLAPFEIRGHALALPPYMKWEGEALFL